MAMQRFIVQAVGPDVEAEKLGFSWLVQTAGQGEAAIVVPTLDTVRNLDRVLGRDVAEQLAKDQQLNVMDGPTIKVFTSRTQPMRFEGPIWVPWAKTETVERVEGLYPSAICASGWAPGDLDDWIRSWSPTDLGGKPQEIEPSTPSVELRGAVKQLSGMPSSDVVHPSDKQRAIDWFKALRIEGVEIDPPLVRRLALDNNWSTSAADRLKNLAAKIAEGRSLRGGTHMTKTRAKKMVAHLRDQA